MCDLVERVKNSLVSYNNLIWFPHLTKDLVKIGWRDIIHTYGLTKSNYSTGRLISGNLDAQCGLVACISSLVDYMACEESAIQIELLADDIAHKYRKDGVDFYTIEEIVSTTVLDCLTDAITLITRVPSLAATVTTLTKTLHIIRPEDDANDVSFSEPHIPFSIFVSVPLKRQRNDALRVAESIVHEAMHLQLTLVERITPLIKHSDKTYYSPWREEYRPIQGVLHASYVFRVIDEFLAHLQLESSLSDENIVYIDKRRKQIADQIRKVQYLKVCHDLTREAQSFAKRLIERSQPTCVTI
ncbi:MAG TPA: HEXXH motif-containing putative peptide modification protein [Pyrinomonadaceae bacterium]|jgi:HEXXH motif-containing protein|nr:HEXXH motif-containing putative peptide modification protein [Pyrinomonadaceae bacterium]